MISLCSFAGFENSYFKGSYFWSSPRVYGQKFYSSKMKQLSNSSTNLTLNNIFEKHLHVHFDDKLKDQISTGIPILNIPCLDPLEIEQIKLEPLIGNDPFKIVLTNFKLQKLSKYTIKDVIAYLNELRFKMTIMFPKLEANCAYLVNGTLYDVFDAHGSGFGTIEYYNVLIRINVNLNLINETLSIASVDPPFVDYSRSMISLKSDEGKLSSSGSLVSEIGPILFWMLADEVVQKLDDYSYFYLNQVLKTFKLPANFKPTVTWLLKRTSSSFFKHSSALTFLTHILNAMNGVKSQINIPFLVENLKGISSSLGTSIKRLI